MPAQISHNSVATFHYTLRDGEGTVLDSSDGDEPLTYLHGHENIVPGLEKAMVGKKVGDKFQVSVQPTEGYGEHDPEGLAVLERSDMPDDIEVGMPLIAEDEDGEPLTVWVVDIDEDEVTVDMNHPLAGVTLNFDIEVLEIREALAVELQHGHPHGRSGTEAHEH